MDTDFSIDATYATGSMHRTFFATKVEGYALLIPKNTTGQEQEICAINLGLVSDESTAGRMEEAMENPSNSQGKQTDDQTMVSDYLERQRLIWSHPLIASRTRLTDLDDVRTVTDKVIIRKKFPGKIPIGKGRGLYLMGYMLHAENLQVNDFSLIYFMKVFGGWEQLGKKV